MLFVAVLLLGGSFIVYAAADLFNVQSNFVAANPMVLAFEGSLGTRHPSLSHPPLRSDCSRLTLDSEQSTIPSFAGRPATLVYACGKGGDRPAFVTTESRSDNSPSTTPIFTVPPGWTFSIGKAKSSGECSVDNKMVSLSSGIPITLPSSTDYVYCLATTSASSFSTFSISWSQ